MDEGGRLRGGGGGGGEGQQEGAQVIKAAAKSLLPAGTVEKHMTKQTCIPAHVEPCAGQVFQISLIMYMDNNVNG